MQTDDFEVSPSHIRSLSNRDGVASFFLMLGYNVDRNVQSTVALGIAAEGLKRQISHIERIAVQDDWLHVYLFEMRSMRLADRQALARAFRNRSGDYLLVLTSDYDTLDFVLLERVQPEGNGTPFARKQVMVRPRVLTVDRHKPSTVDLRVLRRFTYTESDVFYQFDKLLSAYAVAEWSEPLFNNRALFSDYYLTERLPDSEEGQQDPTSTYRALQKLMVNVRSRLAPENETTTQAELLEPAFERLGFAWEKPASSRNGEAPDYFLYPPDGGKDEGPLALCLAYKWNRYLDGRDETRDTDRPEDNPGARVVTLLEQGEAPYVILTNGKLWRLYAAKAHSRATNYYEIDLEEALNSPDRELAIRYFWLFFRMTAFVPVEVQREGETRTMSFLDRMMEDSETYAKELGERLKDRVFEEIFPQFARGFIEHIRQMKGKDTEIDQKRLDLIYQGTLTFLYRLMFLLYAEARDLLPVKEERGYWLVSLQRLKEEIADKAIIIVDEAPDKLRKAYRADGTELYDRLSQLFRIIDLGDLNCNVPRYNGGLFLTEPDDDSGSQEAVTSRFLRDCKIPDRYLALGLDRLARDLDQKTYALVMIDFKSLGVRHLGSIYEGLLEFKLRIAPEKMAIVKGKRTEEVIPYTQAKRKRRKILTTGRGKNRRERTYPKGAVYLENTRQERKATGSYYTPDYIVKYIVEHTVGPVLAEKLEGLRPRIREAEKMYFTHRKNAEAKSKAFGRFEDPEKFWNRDDMLRLAYDVLDIKVLDPAMGSGHFLVEAVDFITDRLLHFLNGFPHNPVRASLRRTRQAILEAMEQQRVSIDPGRLNDVALIKRQVLKRCVYGVDLNPMAVELAKVSLWLDAFTLGAPLSFLDHHLRCGNSLIGATARQVEADFGEELPLFGGPFAGLLRSAEIMRGIGMLADATIEQAQESAGLFRSFEEAAKPYKQLLDIYTMRHFGVRRADEFLRLYGAEAMKARRERLGSPYREVLEQREQMCQQYRFFHWDLEFPEVFIDLERATWRQKAGFDAVIGNPPYVNAIELNKIVSKYEKPYWKTIFSSASGAYDLYVLFLELSPKLCKPRGRSGLITPNKYLAAPYAKALRNYLYSEETLVRFYDVSRVMPFDDSDVYPIVTIVEHGKPSEPYLVRVSQAWGAVTLEWTYESRALTSLPENIWGFLLSHVDGYPVLMRIVNQSRILDTAGEVVASSTAREADRYSKVIVRSPDGKRPGMPIIDTGTIDRFDTSWGVLDGEPVLFLDSKVVPERRIDQYRRPKLIFAKLALRIEAMCDTIGEFASRNTNFAFAEGHPIEYYAAVCNSSLLSWVYKQFFGALAMSGGYLQFQAPQLRLLPICHIDFTTLPRKRAALCENVLAYYRKSSFGALLIAVNNHLECGERDVVHDLLVALARQMIGLHRDKWSDIKRFLSWLEGQLGAQIDNLSGKTIIRNYLGNYQKGEGELPFDEFLHRLHNNRSTIRANLSDPAFVHRLRQEYQASLEVLLPIKRRLKQTDRLIDQIVYKLYGLTDEEIAIVEGRA